MQQSDAATIGEKALANAVIHGIHSEPWHPERFPAGHGYSLRIVEVPVRDLTDAQLAMATLTRAKCGAARFDGADLTYANLAHADLRGATFARSTMLRTQLHRARLDEAYFTDRSAALGDDPDAAAAEDWHPLY